MYADELNLSRFTIVEHNVRSVGEGGEGGKRFGRTDLVRGPRRVDFRSHVCARVGARLLRPERGRHRRWVSFHSPSPRPHAKTAFPYGRPPEDHCCVDGAGALYVHARLSAHVRRFVDRDDRGLRAPATYRPPWAWVRRRRAESGWADGWTATTTTTTNCRWRTLTWTNSRRSCPCGKHSRDYRVIAVAIRLRAAARFRICCAWGGFKSFEGISDSVAL